MTNLKVGERAPNFKLPDQNGKIHTLDSQSGKWVLLYFYPKDDTPGCTKEACSIRDNFPDFTKLGITVFGVSVDSTVSHKKFAQKYALPFTLLSDNDKTLVNAYGVWDKSTKRTSFLINPEGNIAKIYENVKPDIHARQILEDFKKLN